ncbi:MAG: N-acetylmuramoyl-L-alanine amidase [Prevotella pectinovora]|uniref:N-acetylmuramoyl-L-alanine amidase family protein n=1 Tax=Prevotella pectinovora TaxID=1602169 RepID=UPI002A83FC78|nr:N-acetylmuramoyl-L-alanine amidase [Prevotella pectinovora]MDY4778189.1 N-acetylmuramoyl-L-alanine amidase [Prevotella pectinovora]
MTKFAEVKKYSCYTLIRALLVAAFMILVVADVAARQFTLVIDAGHGGHDAGAKGSFSYEKNINLKMALAFGRYVEKNCPDVKVIYTRKTDVFVPLHKRADIANKNRADVFISIHTNALPGGRIARGMETYTMGMRRSNEKLSAAQRENAVITYESDYKERYEGYDPNSPESAIMFEFIHDKNMAKSVELAKHVQKSVCSTANRPDKGVKQDVFLVLRETSMPACLIELGFITTPDEERLLNDDASIDNIARGIYSAFAKYKNDNYSGVNVPLVAPKESDKVSLPTLIPQDDTDKQKNRNAARNSETTASKPQSAPSQPRRAAAKTVNAPAETSKADDDDAPVFKVQIMANATKEAKNSPRFKGYDGIDMYEEGGMYKYTIGASTNYNAINRLRASLATEFPGCFIVAFRNGSKMNITEAIRIFKQRR